MRGAMMALVVAAAVATGAEARAMSCSIVTSTGVSFGSYDVFDPTPRDSVGTITYRCTGVGSDVVTIHLSQGGAPTFFPRRLTQGSYWLEYNLFLNAARTTIWGDGMGGTSAYGPVVPAEGQDTILTIYGRLPPLQNARVGTYDDTIIATVIF